MRIDTLVTATSKYTLWNFVLILLINSKKYFLLNLWCVLLSASRREFTIYFFRMWNISFVKVQRTVYVVMDNSDLTSITACFYAIGWFIPMSFSATSKNRDIYKRSKCPHAALLITICNEYIKTRGMCLLPFLLIFHRNFLDFNTTWNWVVENIIVHYGYIFFKCMHEFISSVRVTSNV